MGVDEPVALADQAVHLTVSGLDPGALVAVWAQATDFDGELWRASARFEADRDGVVDLDRDAPESGSYQDADAMGLFWSMDPVQGEPDQAVFLPSGPTFEVVVAACVDGEEVTRTSLTREWISDGVSRRSLFRSSDGVVGQLFLPPEGTAPGTGVLLIGGSGGGVSHRAEAALLASRGHPALAVAYFRAPGLPDELRDIPLEYFAEAAELLAAETPTSAVAVLGQSRGGEPALLLAQHYPELVHGTVVYTASSRVQGAFPSQGVAWTHGGEPVPSGQIPLDDIAGPVLAIAGGQDPPFWPADSYAVEIQRECEKSQPAEACEVLIYRDAGHFVGTVPFSSTGTVIVHPVSGETIDWGGTRAANEAAKRDGWPRVLDFLAGLP